jgi:hypothetical protein
MPGDAEYITVDWIQLDRVMGAIDERYYYLDRVTF